MERGSWTQLLPTFPDLAISVWCVTYTHLTGAWRRNWENNANWLSFPKVWWQRTKVSFFFFTTEHITIHRTQQQNRSEHNRTEHNPYRSNDEEVFLPVSFSFHSSSPCSSFISFSTHHNHHHHSLIHSLPFHLSSLFHLLHISPLCDLFCAPRTNSLLFQTDRVFSFP